MSLYTLHQNNIENIKSLLWDVSEMSVELFGHYINDEKDVLFKHESVNKKYIRRRAMQTGKQASRHLLDENLPGSLAFIQLRTTAIVFQHSSVLSSNLSCTSVPVLRITYYDSFVDIFMSYFQWYFNKCYWSRKMCFAYMIKYYWCILTIFLIFKCFKYNKNSYYNCIN